MKTLQSELKIDVEIRPRKNKIIGSHARSKYGLIYGDASRRSSRRIIDTFLYIIFRQRQSKFIKITGLLSRIFVHIFFLPNKQVTFAKLAFLQLSSVWHRVLNSAK